MQSCVYIIKENLKRNITVLSLKYLKKGKVTEVRRDD